MYLNTFISKFLVYFGMSICLFLFIYVCLCQYALVIKIEIYINE